MEKRYHANEAEKEMQELWEQEEIYKFHPEGEGEVYSIDTPPPTVSGSLHIGHLFSYTQAEFIARFRRMQGYNVFYPFGFDDNGLPTERLVEREEGIYGKDLPRSEFNEMCKKTTEKYEKEFQELWKTLGFSVDWSAQYETIHPDIRKLSQSLFLELVKGGEHTSPGKAYVKESPVLWCTECQTSIAQAELDTNELDSVFYQIPFCVEEKQIMIATTRPELLYGCVCLFIHPKDIRFQELQGKLAVVPLYNYEIPILLDDKVDMEKGTGIVMCATFGDSTDMQWYMEHQLPYRKVILPDGKVADDVPYLGGLNVRAARKEVIRLLGEKGLLHKEEKLVHTVAVHERCGKEVEIISSRQWYIDILTEKERFLKAADEIKWYPAAMKNRYITWVENLKWDWCISRQRYFGVPFPVWYCKECGTPVYAAKEQLPVNPLETPYEGECHCGCKEFVPEEGVLDTWATSSITPQINERLGLSLVPMSMRTHAHEIIRTWTFYTIVRSLYHTGKVPWKELMINGFVLAARGEKISKSKKNSQLSPGALIEQHSADSLRYWSANAKLGTDTFFDPEELTISKRFITKLWNASKFAISHLEDIELDKRPELLPVDRWIMERMQETIGKVTELLYEYEIGSARHEIDEFFWKDFCDYYIEIVKTRLYQPEHYGYEERRSGQYALYDTLLNILKLYGIYVPHITEYIYQKFFRQYEQTVSLHLQKWDKPGSLDTSLLTFGDYLKESVGEMRKYKSEHNLSMRAEMEELIVQTPLEFLEWFELTQNDLQACSNARKVVFRSKDFLNRNIYIKNNKIALVEYIGSLDDLDCFTCWQDEETQKGYNFKRTGTFEEFTQRGIRSRFIATIIRLSDNECVGTIFVSPESSLPDMAIMIYKPYRGMGYGKLAFSLGVTYCFDTLNLDVIYAGSYPGNHASLAMLKFCGFLPHPEGNQKEKHFLTGEDIVQNDFVIYKNEKYPSAKDII